MFWTLAGRTRFQLQGVCCSKYFFDTEAFTLYACRAYLGLAEMSGGVHLVSSVFVVAQL